MTDAKVPTPGAAFDLGIAFSERAGQPVVNFVPSPELVTPPDYADRIEWVRKSYERFIEKVMEIETLRSGPSLAF